MSEERKIRNDIVAVGLLAVIVFLMAALATYDPADPVSNASPILDRIYQPDQLVYPQNSETQNACGQLGAWVSDMLIHVLGVGAYFLMIGLVALEIALFQKQSVAAPWMRTIGWTLSLLGIATLASMFVPDWSLSPIIGAGGYVGKLGTGVLGTHVGPAGSMIIASTLLLVGLMMWTEYLVFRAGRLMFAPALVTASKVLPFGLLYGFFTWFNGRSRSSELAEDEDGYEEEYDEFDENEESDEPRTIRFRRRDVSDAEDFVEEVVAEEGAELEDEYEDEEEYEDEAEEEEDDEEEYEDVEAVDDDAPQTLPLVKRGIAALTGKRNTEPTTEQKTAAKSIPAPHFKAKPTPPPKPKSEREVVMEQLDEADRLDNTVDYELPEVNMLIKGNQAPFEQLKREAMTQAQILERTCDEFGFKVKVVEVETGPVISQFEIQLAKGLRLNKITSLADDLAIALRVPSVRIVAPIPGKNSVGIEVPNETRQVVRLREVMEQSQKEIESYKIPLFLGKDAVGAPMVADLAKLPHLLIAGRTGTGKSVCLNAIISSILMTRRPDEVRMLMIDPKMVELSGYARLPHLMHPVVTDMRKAEAILAWAVDKMEERYKLLAKAGVRHVTTYNQLGEEELVERLKPENDADRKAIPSNLPFIVIIADEMADLMMTAGKEVESHIIRLAQKSRAVGIHLILATQKPTVDVITGLIKSNLPARIAFQVASKMDSRVVLDEGGADKLLGMGDMLFLAPGTSTLLRGQGTFLTDEEIDKLTDEVSTGEQNFVHELVNLQIDKPDDTEAAEKVKSRDDLYEKAVEVVVREQRGSVSLLQRSLQIGYGRGAKLIDYMQEDGIVGPYAGSKAREVLIDMAQWDRIQAGGQNEETAVAENDTEILNLERHVAPPKPKAIKPVSANTLSQIAQSTVAFPVDEAEEVDEELETEEELEEDDFEEDNDVENALEHAVEDELEQDEEEYEYEEEDDEEVDDDGEVAASADDDEYEYVYEDGEEGEDDEYEYVYEEEDDDEEYEEE